MYRIDDRSEAIKEVQGYLREIFGGGISVVPSGVYDENTRLAVVDFQRKMSLEETGVVDYVTFSSLYGEYLKEKKSKEARRQVENEFSFPIKEGQSGFTALKINRMTARLLDYYRTEHIIKCGEYISSATLDAIGRLAAIYGINEKNEIDEEIYLMIERDFRDAETLQKSE